MKLQRHHPYKILVVRYLTFFTGLSLLLMSCGVRKPWYSDGDKKWQQGAPPKNAKLVHAIYLLGDAGEITEGEKESTLKLVRRKIQGDSVLDARKKTVLFLGDNAYERGLPPESAFDRKQIEKELTNQLDVVKNHPGRKIMIPGNHDWNIMTSRGWEYIKREQEFVDQYMGDSSVFLPKGGCPGPVEVPLENNIMLLVIDSQWWLHHYERPYGVNSPCDIEDEFDFTVQLHEAIHRNRNKHVIIAMHHPLYSNGNHGGYYSLKDNIFPLTLIRSNLYIPLPLIGSLYPFLRKYGISRQDIPNPKYRQLRSAIMNVLDKETKVVITSGHDHNLQLHKIGETHHIISGSAAKLNHVIRGNHASFIAKDYGFSILKYYNNGQVWVEFWTPDEANPDGKMIFRKPLYSIPIDETPVSVDKKIPDYRDSTIVMAASTDYRAKSMAKEWFFGTAYRREWATPVKLKYLDMKTEAKGLTPIRKGGGMQTLSLRCKGGDGNQYTLRLIQKDPAAVLPPGLRETFAEELVQDQMSSAHPYGALAVPKLADAAGVYHTNPKLVYIPHTPQLGEFLDEFGGKMALLEIRPDEDLSEFSNFGRSKNVVSTATLLEKLDGDNDNKIDAKSYLRARYLDILINDWDRHSDQWRWAEFEKEKGAIYRPVPRDRDQVFAKYNGIMPQLVSSRFFVRDISTFDYKIRDIIGQTESAVHLDKKLLNELEKDDWMEEAKAMQQKLTDEVISAAVKDLPPEVYKISGANIEAKLKQRRDDLLKYALRYYDILSKKTDISFSNKGEFIVVERRKNGDVQVKAWKRDIDPGEKDEIKHKLYERDFHYGETKEIRIYCQEGKDSVLLLGGGAKSIKVRIIAGHGRDYVKDNSHVDGLQRKTQVYDYDKHIEVNNLVKTKEAAITTSRGSWVNEYNIRDFRYPKSRPLLFIQYDIDYGVFLGGGLQRYFYGFRANPYTSMYKIRANRSLSTTAFNVDFAADYPVVFGQKSGLNVDLRLDGPDYVINYFGQGNESRFEGDIHPYRIGLNYYRANISFTHRVNNNINFTGGPIGEYVAIKSVGNSVESGFRGQDFHLAGAKAGLTIDYTNHKHMPTRGVKWENELSYRHSVASDDYSFGKYTTRFNFYYEPDIPLKLSIALRLGGDINAGKYPFYHSAFLGGNSTTRGFRAYRFAGRNSFYQNLEARMAVSRLRTYVLSGIWGAYGFIDNGRVWADNDFSAKWHTGYGGGLWLRVYDLFMISGGIGLSMEGTYFRINGGFFF